MSESLDIEARRVLWRCRRGMKELDVLLERFARERYASLSSDQRRAFEQLLDLPDPQLAAYLLRHETPPEPHLAQLIPLLSPHRA